jgi:hypothetical protein
MISMFLHELSRKLCREWGIRVEGIEYIERVKRLFGNNCPYCLCDLSTNASIVEHLDGMNRHRVGLHVPGNVLITCKRCNSEKRRDDSLKTLKLAESGWASFLSHDGTACLSGCATCNYWKTVWPDEEKRKANLAANRKKIATFRAEFIHFDSTMSRLLESLPDVLSKMYSDCQNFAEREISKMLNVLDI